MSFVMADFNPFAAKVINISLNGPNEPNYLPALGYWINDPCYNDADKALGAPLSGGTWAQDNNSVVSLGGFGGQIVLAFDHNVENNPANPLGLDAIVFSNSFWPDGNQTHFTEPATIEIMPELNDNNTPGDDPCEIWYLIPGSDLNDASTYRTKQWQKDGGGLPSGWYPDFTDWPDQYQTSAYELSRNFQANGSVVNPYFLDSDPCNNHLEAYWGYAEYTPTIKLGDRDADDANDGYGDCPNMPAEIFYTIPDDPFLVGITPASGGGDAFDIEWAVEPNTFQPANLKSFRYIRITTAIEYYAGAIGEISAEIDGVSDVRPVGDINGDNEIDYYDMELFTQAWLTEWPDPCFNPAADFAVDNKIDLFDYAEIARGWNLNVQY